MDMHAIFWREGENAPSALDYSKDALDDIAQGGMSNVEQFACVSQPSSVSLHVTSVSKYVPNSPFPPFP